MTLVFEGVSKVVNGQTPDYPKLAQLWWQNIGDASSGAKSVQEAMDSLCAEQEKVMSRIEASGVQGDIGPKMV